METFEATAKNNSQNNSILYYIVKSTKSNKFAQIRATSYPFGIFKLFFQLVWPNGFREKKTIIGQSHTTMTAILVVRSARNIDILFRISHSSFLQRNDSLFLLISEENIF